LHWNHLSFGDIQVCGRKAKIHTGFVTITAIFAQSTGDNMETVLRKSLIWVLVGFLALPGAPLSAAESAQQTIKPEEIEQLVAPIALYPDSLLSQIFMASTYPLEVVEASRWTKQNQNLKGDALAQALEKQDWDPSVRSLVNFPDVLSKMSDKLDWTQKLGDAFLSQQKEVMDAVQRLRAKAQAAGNLQTTEQQKVIVEEKVIKIESPSPQVVYVPTYNPTVVYGAWPYPAYPPYPWYPPGYAFGASMLAFGTGVALGAAWGYAWGGCNWGRGDVDVNINRNTNFNNTINRNNFSQKVGQGGQGQWQHDPSHRKGVGYRDNNTAQKFNRGSDAQAAKAREDFRGRAEGGRQELARQGGPGDRGGLGEKGGLGDRGGVGDKGGLGDRGGTSKGGGVGDRGGLADRGGSGGGVGDRGGGPGNRGGGGGGDAFQGMGRGGDVRSASSRGAASRSSSASRGGGGGGARAGGGGGRGGGGGGGGGRRR
jgi:Protein of unknown function (DUF3300)